MTRRLPFPVGSTAWLLAHEVRLVWRGVGRGAGAGRRALVLGGFFVFAMLFIGAPVGFVLRHATVVPDAVAATLVDVTLAVLLTLMVSGALASAAEAFYARGDLDLLLSSPTPPNRVLMVRALSIAVNIFFAAAALISPVLLPVAMMAHPSWLAAYGVLAAIALGACGIGLLMAVALFRLVGPRRTRAVAQVLAAMIGAAVFLGGQARNLMSRSQLDGLIGRTLGEPRPGAEAPPLARLPMDALMGAPAPLLSLLFGGAAIFLVGAAIMGGDFAGDAAAASGAAGPAARAPRRPVRFARGPFAATLVKELRLIARDAPLLSQVLLRLLYLLPLTLVAMRAAASHKSLVLPGLVAAIAFMAGQAAASLAWVTVSAEDAPDLIASAPAAPRLLRRAKLAAALTPVAVVLALPLLGLTVLAWWPGLVAILGSAAAAVGCALINGWRPRPARRAEFRRRQGASWILALAEFTLCLLVSGATGLAASGSILALAPLALAGAALVALSRDEARIAAALAAK